MNPPETAALRRLLTCLCVLLSVLAAPLAVQAAIDPGEVLVGQLNCVSCHDASAPVKARLASPPAPILGENGWRITPQWLRAYLADPQAVKPGTLMPDSLHGMPPAQKAAAADALTHYLISLQSPRELSGGMDSALAAKGRALYHSVGCVACHAPEEAPPRAPGDDRTKAEMDDAVRNAASLAHPEMKTGILEMAAFLRDPLKFRPSGRMPSMKLGDEEATAIAAYIQREQRAGDAPVKVPGLTYEYYEENLTALPKFDRLHPKTKGIATRINLDPHRRNDNFALRFRGNLTVETEGEYTFYTTSDDGTQLLIDDKPVVDNSGIHPALERSGRIVLKHGDHAFTLDYFNNVGERALSVAWQGPNIPKQEIPPAVLSHSAIPMVPVGTAAFTLDPAKVAQGRQLFASLNCVACHQLGSEDHPPAAAAKALAVLDIKRAGTCIDPDAGPGLPKYDLSDVSRRAIRATLAAQASLAQPLAPAARIERAMTALNCYACHNRDQHGGPEGIRREYFATVGEADMGDEGRLPPQLDGVGAKLRTEAIEAILWQGASVRPYMATRMPQFGKANVQDLPPAFGAADDPAGDPGPEMAGFPSTAAYGRKLAGTGGVGCIACHNFNNHPSLGIPAIDMTQMYARLKPAWFHRYVIDPQALRPGTRMPSFWPDGQAVNREILGGDTDKQIAALWQFLSKGKNADNPDGLISGKMELLPTKEALIYRNFIQGASPRGIGVGYPEKANLVFDADEMRIDLLWQGAFIDASRHRTGRAQGAEPPMGINVVNWTPGAPLAVLAGADAPWPVETGHDAGYQFRGYRLDKKQRPTFLYTFGNVRVEDFPIAVRGEVEAGFKRTLTFHASKAVDGLSFRAAVGDKIEPAANGAYLVNGKVLVSLPGAQAIVREQGGHKELLAPVHFQNGEAQIEENLTW